MRGQRETRPCAGCGKKLTKLVSQAPAANWFCSRQCQISHFPPAAKSFNPYSGQQDTRPCVVCGDSVTRYLTAKNHDRPWTCSRTCMGKNQRRRQLADGTWTAGRKPRTGDVVACLTCGKDLYRQPAYIVQNRRYCSQPCWNQAQRVEQIVKVCPQCGKDFPVRPSEQAIKHCSRACQVKTNTKGDTGRVHNERPVIRNFQGYLTVYEPTHPAANVSGRVLEHRLVVEKVLGRYLRRDEQVNHINHVKDDNRPENLEILSPSDHGRETNAYTLAAREAQAARLAAYEAKYGPLED